MIGSWLAPAPSTRTSSRDRMRAGICRSAAVSTAAWSAKVFDPALPGRSSIASDSAVLASQAPRGWKPYPISVKGGCGAFLVAAGGDQRGVQVDDQPACQQLPGDGQPREPGRPRRDQRPDVRADRRPRPGDLVQGARIGQLQRPPHRRVARLRTQDRAVVGQQGDVGHAGGPERDRRRHGHQRHAAVHQRELPFACQRRSQRRGQPGPGRPACATVLPRHARPGPRPRRSPSARDPTAYPAWRRALLPGK